MAGNRRHDGGVKSAMANLSKIDERIAVDRAALAAAVPWPAHRLIGYAKNYLGRGDAALARGLLDEATAAERRSAVGLEDGGLAHARELALASLQASLGEDHSDYVLITTTPGIRKDEALKKYLRLMDRNLREPVTDEDKRRAAAVGKPDGAHGLARSRAIARVASPREIQEFALQVGGFSWPASYGSSPWEHAFSLAVQLGFVAGLPAIEFREVRTTWDALNAECVRAYREERQRVDMVRSHEAPRPDPQVPTLYIYPTEAGQMSGQILDHRRLVWGVGGCEDRNAVIEAATDAGYQNLRIADVPHMNDVLEVEREEDEAITGTPADGDRDEERDPGR
jgi:hypothetical protein